MDYQKAKRSLQDADKRMKRNGYGAFMKCHVAWSRGQTELVPVILLDIHFKNVPELFYNKKGKGTPVKRPVLYRYKELD